MNMLTKTETKTWFYIQTRVVSKPIPATAASIENCTQVIVIGGGMAGLAASAHLTQSGFNVVLVEAANYLGGRVKQVSAFDGWPPVDVGGEFIHGHKTITYQLAVENNWETEIFFDNNPESETEWIHLDGEMLPYFSTHPDIVAAHTAYDDFISWSRETESNDANDEEDISAAEYFTSHLNLSPKSSHIFNILFCQTEATTLETYGSLEQRDFEKSWNCGEGNYRWKNSQEQLVKYYLKACEDADTRLNWQAREIKYTSKDGNLENSCQCRATVTNQNGHIFQAQAVIICVPLTVLKDGDIRFEPEFPEDKQTAIQRIRMHTGLKITCRFSHRFWPPKCKLVYNCTSDVSQVWMYTNLNEVTGEECHIVTGFQTAEYARQKAHLTADEVKAIFINDLDKMFANEETSTPASKYLIDFVYYHWSSSPFVRGAYSSPSVNARGSREILARPVENLFFAGEATRSGGDCCTVSGAIESGIRAAEEVKILLTSNK